MRERDAALSHQLYQVAIAQFISDVPSNTEEDDVAIKVATMKQRGGEWAHAADYQSALAFASEPLLAGYE
jgi:hypothetical protein